MKTAGQLGGVKYQKQFLGIILFRRTINEKITAGIRVQYRTSTYELTSPFWCTLRPKLAHRKYLSYLRSKNQKSNKETHQEFMQQSPIPTRLRISGNPNETTRLRISGNPSESNRLRSPEKSNLLQIGRKDREG